MAKQRVSIIGTGALGSVLTRALNEAEYPIAGIYNRTRHKTVHIFEDVGADEVSSFPSNKNTLGEVVFLTVGDQQITPVAQQLSKLSEDFSDTIFVHCSGSKPAASLRVLSEKGASIASYHPLQTFTAQSQPSDFKGVYIDMEGDESALVLLEELATDLGANTMHITTEAKPYLHAAAVMASNNMVALVEAATQIAAMGDIDKTTARKALLPLIRQSIENISSRNKLVDALSGPVARGDVKTVEDHLELLNSNSELQSLYKQMGRVLVDLAGESGDDVRYEKLNKLLREKRSNG